jgi:predicted nucleotidyltransferase
MPGEIPEAVRPCLELLRQRLQQDLGDNLLEIRLFGSYARGEARTDSDVDVLVLVRDASLPIQKQVSAVAADVGLDYDLVLATLVWDPEHHRRHELMQTLLLRNLQDQGVILWSHP